MGNGKFQDALATLDRDGVATIPGVFSQEEVNKIRAAGISSLAADGIHSRVRKQFKERDGVPYPALSFWPALTVPFLNRIRIDERLAEIARAVLGDEIKQLNNQFYFRLPGDGDEFAWHQDIFFRDNDEEFPGIAEKYLQTAIILDDVQEDSGAVEYVLGSHKEGRIRLLDHDENAPKKLRQFVRGGWQGTKQLPKAGDVVIWSVMIVHGSEQNKSNQSRMVYMNGFAAASASKYFPHYMQAGKVIEDLDIGLFPETAKEMGNEAS